MNTGRATRSRRGWRCAATVAAAMLLLVRPAGAQSYFGQTQVQYDRFRWRVKESEHFLLFYYPEEGRAVEDEIGRAHV